MLKLFRRSLRRLSSQGRSVRLGLERLEDRDCPAAPTITLSAVLTNIGKGVVLSGHVTDENPAGLSVMFNGKATGSTTTDASGNYSYTATASALGTITATTTDREMLISNQASATISSNTPVIDTFDVVLQSGTGTNWIWIFSGHVTDEAPQGMVVHFSGSVPVQTVYAVVDSDGDFAAVVQLPANSCAIISAQTADVWGQLSGYAQDTL